MGKRNREKLTYERIALVMFILFLVSLLPILYCSFFDYATGDDLWEGAAAYRVLVNGGSVSELFKAVYNWAKADYYGWEGNWSSIVLWCFPPNIWGERVYCITPWIALISLCGGFSYFFYHYLRKYLQCDRIFVVIVAVIICFFSVQYMPKIRGGIFWYTGMINYVFPFGWSLAALVWADKFLEAGKMRYYVGTIIVFAYLGGAGYQPIVLAFEMLLCLILFHRKERREKRVIWLGVPLFLLMAGFAFSALSPGNAVRGGEDYYFSVSKIFVTIWESIKRGSIEIPARFFTVRPMLLVIPLLSIATWEKIDVHKAKIKFTHPVLTGLFLFLISCSVYAPEIYAKSEVSGGVPDTVFFTFMLAYICGIIYLTGYFKQKLMKKRGPLLKQELLHRIRFLVVLGELLFCLVAGKHLIGNMGSYICFGFIRSGQLKDFEYQMQERLDILNDPEIVDAVVPEMNSEQGPFMHMALLEDPDSYTNRATARYYGKNTVIAVPRPEFYKKYGYPEK